MSVCVCDVHSPCGFFQGLSLALRSHVHFLGLTLDGGEVWWESMAGKYGGEVWWGIMVGKYGGAELGGGEV